MPRAAKKNGYQMAKPLPKGEILKDVAKKEWILGPSIGKGGFGLIYSANEVGSKSKTYPFAIKIEPHDNGPLFVERSFYIKACKPESLNEWKNKKKLKVLGVPSLQGFGSHESNGSKYRFLVMDKFGSDLWTLFLNSDKVLPTSSVFNYAIQMLDALEYIHSIGYVHCDVKGANLLFGLTKETQDHLFLVDFGLACKFSTDQVFKRDPRKAHNGTIEYTSRDMHQGVATRRGDLEVVGFNLIHWLTSTLPWEKLISDQEKVFQSKTDFMSSVHSKLKAFSPSIPPVIVDFMEYILKLGHLEEPDYSKCRGMFEKALKSLPADGEKTSKKSPRKRSRAQQKVDDDLETEEINGEQEEEETEVKKTKKRVAKKAGKSWRDAPLFSGISEIGPTAGKFATESASLQNPVAKVTRQSKPASKTLSKNLKEKPAKKAKK